MRHFKMKAIYMKILLDNPVYFFRNKKYLFNYQKKDKQKYESVNTER